MQCNFTLSVPFSDPSSALDGGGTRVHAKFLLKSPNAVLVKENYHKGDRGVGKEVSKPLFFRTGFLVPVGLANGTKLRGEGASKIIIHGF